MNCRIQNVSGLPLRLKYPHPAPESPAQILVALRTELPQTVRTVKTPVQRVLIYRLGSLGDTLVALPALHLVARAFPDAERRLLANIPVLAKAPAAASILRHTDLVHDYLRYPVGTRSPWALLALAGQLRRWRPQVLVYLAAARGLRAARRDALFFRLCGISHQIGVPLTPDLQQNRIEPNGERGPDFAGEREPEAARLARTLAPLGDARLDDPESWSLHLTPAEIARAREALVPAGDRPMLAVSVGTKVQSKDWGRDNWRALLGRLVHRHSRHALVLLGAADEHALSQFAASDWHGLGTGPLLNLCGQLSPRESAAVLAHARLFLGHDSGPMHLAAAVQTPCVAIFAARNLPRVWFPYGDQHRILYHPTSCAGCGLETCIAEQKRCLTAISVDEVLAEIDIALSSQPTPPRRSRMPSVVS
jgi:heptosyltransferase III